jgi:hypothetical protein
MTSRKRLALALVVSAATGLLAPPQSGAAVGTTFTVTSTVNSGAGTLRQAITDANGNLNAPDVDRIEFDVAGNGPHTFAPTTALPSITEPVVIDGYTQGDGTPGDPADDARDNDEPVGSTNAVLKIELDGTTLPGSGLLIDSSDVTVRGLVVNDWGSAGILLDSGLRRVRLEGNFIGTDVTGTSAIPNANGGVSLASDDRDITIGGTSPAARNLISGNNGTGIQIGSDPVKGLDVLGNLIGTEPDGVSALGNTGAGFLIRHTKNADINVGGKDAASANVIAHNGTRGIEVNFDGSGAKILRNSIFSNGLLGIDLIEFFAGAGVSENDAKDKDQGTNGLQNFPVLTSATSVASETTIKGTLNSKPNSKFLIQFFSSTDPDGSGNGEGQTFLGQVSVTTNGNGNARFTKLVPDPPAGQDDITATATRKSTGDTSEFSDAILLT